MARREGWENRLQDVVNGAALRDLALGSHDCLLFALRALDALHGTAYEANHAGKYRTAAGSQRYAMRFAKQGGFRPAMSVLLGIPFSPVLFAQRGDPVLYVDDAGIEYLGVCIGSVVVIPSATAGLVRVSLGDCCCCWRTECLA